MRASSLLFGDAVRVSPRSDVATIAALLVLTLCNCLVSIYWGLPDAATPETVSPWAVDTVAPVGPLNEAFHAFTRNGVDNVIYPLFHYVVLTGTYAPYVAVALLTGELSHPTASFPYGAVDPGEFFSNLTLLAGLVSALMAAGIVLVSYLMTRDLFERRAAQWAAVFTALIPPLAYYGMTSNLDVPYLFWTMLALWQLVRAARGQRLANYVLCGVFAGIAAATKDQAAGFFFALPLVIPLLVARGRAQDGAARGLASILLDRRVWGAGLAAVATFALANNLLFGGWDGFLRHLQFADGFYEKNVATDTHSLVERQPAMAAQSFTLIFQMVGPAVLLLSLGGLWIAIRERRYVALVLPLAAAIYYVSIIVPTFPLSRYMLGLVVLAMPFAGLAVAKALETRRAWMQIGLVLAGISIAWQLTLLVHLHHTLWRDSRYAMETWVREHVPAGAVIEAYTQPRYLPRLADSYRYSVVANSFSAVSYGLIGDQLSTDALKRRSPEYVIILADSGVSGDPGRVSEPAIRRYFGDLMGGHSGYVEVARFATPTFLPYRQITAGTQPTTILLARAAAH